MALGAGFVALHRTASPTDPFDAPRALALLFAGFGKVIAPLDPTVLAIARDVAWWPGVAAAAALGLATRFVPGVRRRIVALGVAAFVALLAPALALSGTLVLDHRLYLPACGALLACAEVARAAAFGRTLSAPARLVAAYGAAGAFVLGVLTFAYEGAYRDRHAFARQAVIDSPHSPLAHLCLGQSLQIDGRADRARAEYLAALALGPAEVAHNNLAVLDMKAARWSDAEHELRAELAQNPRYAVAWSNLAIVLRHEDRPDEAAAADRTVERLAADGP
jgi:tetratricopeptide (TPR) repeat protein